MLVWVNRLGESNVGALGARGGVELEPSLGALGGEELGGMGESRSAGISESRAGETGPPLVGIETGGPSMNGALRLRGEGDKGGVS